MYEVKHIADSVSETESVHSNNNKKLPPCDHVTGEGFSTHCSFPLHATELCKWINDTVYLRGLRLMLRYSELVQRANQKKHVHKLNLLFLHSRSLLWIKDRFYGRRPDPRTPAVFKISVSQPDSHCCEINSNRVMQDPDSRWRGLALMWFLYLDIKVFPWINIMINNSNMCWDHSILKEDSNQLDQHLKGKTIWKLVAAHFLTCLKCIQNSKLKLQWVNYEVKSLLLHWNWSVFRSCPYLLSHVKPTSMKPETPAAAINSVFHNIASSL